jgi:hypothetical protein
VCPAVFEYSTVAEAWKVCGKVAPEPLMLSADAIVATDMLPTTTSAVEAITLRKLFMNSSEFLGMNYLSYFLLTEVTNCRYSLGSDSSNYE